MAPKRTRGPAGCSQHEEQIDRGTLVRSPSACPGPISDEDVRQILGSQDWYDDWKLMQQQVKTELKRAERHQNLFKPLTDGGTVAKLYWDTRNLERIDHGYWLTLEEFVFDRDRMETFHAMLSTSLLIVEHDNDVLDSVLWMGALSAFFKSLGTLEARAKVLEKHLLELKKLLEKAKQERTEAWFQAAANVAITAVSACLGPLGLLARGFMYAGQWVLDEALGPKTSDPADKGSKATNAMGSLSGAMAEYAQKSAEERSVKVGARAGAGKAAEKLGSVVGFAFDANEIMLGYENVDAVRSQITLAKSAHRDVLAGIDRVRPGLAKFVAQYNRWQQNVADAKVPIHEMRAELEQMMRQSGLQPLP